MLPVKNGGLCKGSYAKCIHILKSGGRASFQKPVGDTRKVYPFVFGMVRLFYFILEEKERSIVK